MEKITHQNLHPLLSKSLTDTDFVLILNALIKFLRRGGKKQAAERFDLIISTFKQDEELGKESGVGAYIWKAPAYGRCNIQKGQVDLLPHGFLSGRTCSAAYLKAGIPHETLSAHDVEHKLCAGRSQ